MAVDTKNSPYFDDYEEDKKFYRILYRPGFAVQARELTQVQSILQKQIERFGDHVFQEGAMVIPGWAKHDTAYTYVKVVSNSFTADEAAIKNNFLDKIIIGGTSGIRARVNNYIPDAGGGIVYLFIKYVSGSPSISGQKVFLDGETLTVDGSATSVNALGVTSTGVGTGASITRGVYYTNGFFAVVDNQSIVVDKDSNQASARIGLSVIKSIVTPDDDESLLDNATGAPNYAAPGAHRLKIELVLTTKPLSTLGDANEEEDFIELLRIKDGLLERRVNTTAYSVLNDTLARRTYDESGDYLVRPFLLHIREFYNEDGNGGVYTKDDFFTATSTEAVAIGQARFGLTSSPGYHTDISYPTATPFLPGNNITEFENAARAKHVYGVEAGKAYVRGYEIETITQTYVDADKSRETQFVDEMPFRPTFGSYTRITNTNGLPPLGITYSGANSFIKVSLRDRATVTPGAAAGNEIGTARCFFLEFDSGKPADRETVYKVYLFDLQMNAGHNFGQVQQIYWNGVAGPTNFFSNPGDAFTGDIKQVEEIFFGVTVTTASATTRAVLESTNAYWTTLDAQRLVKGDVLKLVTPANTRYAYVVEPATSNSSVVVDLVPAGIIASPVSVSRVYSVIENTQNTKLLFPLENGFIKNLTNETNYKCQKEFLTSPVDVFGEVTIQTNAFDSTEVFDTFSATTFFFAKKSDGEPVQIDSSQVSYELSGRQIRISGLLSIVGQELVAIAPVIRTQHPSSVHKTKTKQTGTLITAAVSASGTQDLRQFYLGKADAIAIKNIWMSPDFTTAPIGGLPDIDISDRYELDNGQRDMFYDIASIKLKPGAQPPSGRIAVIFDWFDHSHDGTYFCVDSYTNIPYDEIPTYYSVESSFDFALSDVLDFRPTINSTRTHFDNSTGSLSFVPFGLGFIDYDFYLHRRDKLYLTTKGEFLIRKGSSAVNPAYPPDPFEGMVLYDLDIRAFTKEPKDVFLNFRDNRRFTMRDIGKLEQRVTNLEYYTQLSLLEKETADLDIKDAEGNDRFKNGFIVDSFNGHGIGNTNSPDYRCSVDRLEGTLRPIFVEQQVKLIEGAGSDGFSVVDNTHRINNNYTIAGDMLMLPIASEPNVVEQKSATKTLNVNPHAVFNFLGTIKLDPPLDQFKDTQVVPELVVNQDLGIFDAFNELTKGYGTIWGEWKNDGDPVTTPRTSTHVSDPEIFPGPAFHLDSNGNPDSKWGNNAMNFLLTGGSAALPGLRKDLRKTERKIRQLKEKKEKTKNKRQAKKIENKIKKQKEVRKEIKKAIREDKPEANTWPLRRNTISVTTEVTRQKQTRSGVKASASPKTVTTSLGEKVVDVSFAEYMRSINIFFSGKLFKPSTEVYPFFERDNVAIHCRPANSSGVATGSYGDPLITDATGTVYGIYTIPAGKYRTGTRVFKLTDSIRNDDTATTQGSTIFQAQGLLEKRQNTILSTRSAEISLDRSPLDSQTIVTDVKSDPNLKMGCWQDPLAQSFLIDDTGGVFLTEIDVFFSSKDEDIPVSIEVREMVNGYPGAKVLPFSRVVLEPADVHTNEVINAHAPTPDDPTDTTGELLIDGVTTISNFTSANLVPTTFRFETPIYLMQGVEYCFVVMANSTKYNVWVSQLGQRNIGTRIPITGQPYAGVLFSSQNASTWSADQSADMTFVLKKAQFDISDTGNIVAINEELPTRTLIANPFKTRQGSNKVKVTHINHGFRNKGIKPRVKFSGVTGPSWLSSALNNSGLDTSYHEVNVLDLDHYYVELPIDAEETLYGTGGSAVSVTSDIQMDILVPTIGELTFPETQIFYSYKATSGNGVHGGVETPYVVDSSYRNFVLGEAIEFDVPKMVCSRPNEINPGIGSVIGPGTSGSKSLFLNIQLRSSNANLSPMIDTKKLSVVAVGNCVDDPGLAGVYNTIVDPVDYVIPGMISATGTVTAAALATTVTVSNGLEFNVGGFILIDDPLPSKKQLREITNIAGNLLTLDRPLLQAVTAAPVKSSSNPNFSFGTSYSPDFTFTADVDFNNINPQALTINDAAALTLAAQFDPGDLINIVSAGANNGYNFRVDRVLVTSTEAIIYVDPTDTFGGSGLETAVTVRMVVDSLKCTNLAVTDAIMQTIKVGKYLRVTGSALPSVDSNNGTYEIKGFNRSGSDVEIFIDYDVDPESFVAPAGLSVALIDDFFSQSSPVSSSGASKYVTRRMTLANPSTAVRVNFVASIPEECDVSVWMKILRTDINGINFDDIPYFEIDPDGDVTSSPSSGTLFREHQFTLDNLPTFSAVSIKVVMESASSTTIPELKELSVIALDV